MSDQSNVSNTRIWEALGKTDPRHTKRFTRSGGFKGTAIKPIWCDLRMTEHFGPCGIGWGPGKPSFQVHPGADGESLVFCTVALWYFDPTSGSKGRVYGVGGDKLVILQSNNSRSSDEAFKAAYTDALGNAMKLIGIAADVHMGLFEDNKYVTEVAAGFAPEPTVDSKPTQMKPRPVLIRKDSADALKSDIIKQRMDFGKVGEILDSFGYKTVYEITMEQLPSVIDNLKEIGFAPRA